MVKRATSRFAVASVLAALVLAATGVSAQAREPHGEEPPELAGRWARIPNAPWGSSFPAYGAVGGAMLVVDRQTGRVQTYDPDTRRSERGARAPRRMTASSLWAWTGEELIVLDRNRPGHMEPIHRGAVARLSA